MLIALSINISGQVGINTDNPDTYAGLHVSERMDPASTDPDTFNGIIIQRYTEAERDTQLTPNMGISQNSLLIYNTTEDCYNYWNNTDQEWKSLCGKLGKSVFTFDCADVEVNGSYVEGRELTTSNYLSIPVNVTKEGEYTVIATTDNGYSFFVAGTFLNTGDYTIQVPGQGTPVAVQTDELIINANGIDIDCTPPVEVEVFSAAGTYTMSCGTATINGVYKVGTPLTAGNTITLPVVVTVLGSYTITTNIVDGISFSGSGTFTSLGNQNVTLYGEGTPGSTSTKTITITSDSGGSVSTSCNVNVIVTIPAKRLLSIGTSANGYGYNLSGTAASGRMITTETNYGTAPNSIIKFEGFTRVNGGASPNVSQLQGWLSGPNPVDILVIGYAWTMSEEEADVIAEYLVKGGVVLAFSESNTGNRRLFQNIFNDNTISTGSVNAAGALYRLPVTNDEIINGPFGDLRGKIWGEDASTTSYVTGIPISEINIYSTDSDLSQASPGGTAGRVTAFKHKNMNLIFVGDGGFNSNCGPSDTICPFEVDENNFPILKSSYGRGTDARDLDVFNSIFTANAIAWAIKQAEFNGINTQ